jgi:hypothetical protein
VDHSAAEATTRKVFAEHEAKRRAAVAASTTDNPKRPKVATSGKEGEAVSQSTASSSGNTQVCGDTIPVFKAPTMPASSHPTASSSGDNQVIEEAIPLFKAPPQQKQMWTDV